MKLAIGQHHHPGHLHDRDPVIRLGLGTDGTGQPVDLDTFLMAVNGAVDDGVDLRGAKLQLAGQNA